MEGLLVPAHEGVISAPLIFINIPGTAATYPGVTYAPIDDFKPVWTGYVFDYTDIDPLASLIPYAQLLADLRVEYFDSSVMVLPDVIFLNGFCDSTLPDGGPFDIIEGVTKNAAIGFLGTDRKVFVVEKLGT